MRIKQRYICQCFVLLFCLPSVAITAQNQTLHNHQRSRNLNSEGYRAYREQNWILALQKFAQSMKLDPYYTYPIYNTACVLSLRGWPQDSYRIYRLLLEVLLQESGELRSIHQAKMQRDPDLAWFRRHEPELFILLNNVILDYGSQEIYRKLRYPQGWNIGVETYRRSQIPKNYREEPKVDLGERSEPNTTAEPDIGYMVPPEERENSITVTPYDQPLDPDFGQDALPDEYRAVTPEVPSSPFSEDFDPFSGDENKNPFGAEQLQEFPGFDKEESNGFAPFVPQSLREQYLESELTLNLVSQQAQREEDQIAFNGYRYIWRFQIGSRLFEMQGFFVIRGNVLILETFASSPEALEGLPFNWEAFRSLFFIYQPQINEFHAVTSMGEQVKIY